MKRVFGIDLGTTNSALAVYTNGISQIIPVDGGHRTIPSVVQWESIEKVVVGRKAYANKGAKNVLFSTKCDMGTDKVYKVETVDSRGEPVVLEVTPVDVACEVLKAIKEGNSGEFGEVEDVVVTVPAYFDERQRQDTLRASKQAGLNCLAILQEPIAATLAYGLYKVEETSSEKLLVVDVGGGTTDITVIQVNYLTKVHKILKDFLSKGLSFSILSTGGDNHLGGDDLDKAIFKKFVERSTKTLGEPEKTRVLQNTPFQRYANTIENWKISSDDTVLSIGVRDENGVEVKDSKGEPIKISQRSSLKEEVVTDSKGFWLDVKKCIMNCLTSELEDERFVRELPQKCLLVGGSTKSLLLQKCIKKFYEEEHVPLTIVSPPSNYSFQDEAVALGAAVKGAILNNTINDISIAQTNPLPIGIEIAKEKFGRVSRGFFKPIVPRDSIIPCKFSTVLTNSTDNQTVITVPLYQGNSEFVCGNVKLGEIVIKDIPPKPAGTQEVRLHLQVSYEGVLSVFVETDGVVKEESISLALGESKAKTLSRREQKQVEKIEGAKNYYLAVGEKEKLQVLEDWSVGDAIPEFLKSDRAKIKAFEDSAISESLTNEFN